jgi:S1-C subfamily serine protease
MAWTVYQIVGAKGRGSGVMLAPDKIVTNCHVIAGSYQPRSIMAINGVTREVVYPEKIAILSDSEDVCLLHAPGAPEYVANWGSANTMPIGAPTYTVSFPGRDDWQWSPGNLVSRENISGLDVLLTSNYCRPGVSGGPLFDEQGNVIGITSAGRKYRLRSGDIVQGECVSIAAETAKEVMWRTLMSLAIAPIKYDGVWSGR